MPDIKGEATFVLDEGHYYPHHNLYFVTSTQWDLRALQAVLRSSVTVLAKDQQLIDEPVFRLCGLSADDAERTQLVAAAAQVTANRRNRRE